MNRKVGLELEYSDVNTYRAVELVYDYFNLDISSWKDSVSLSSKVQLDYANWTAISDSTIKNTDCSRNMISFFEEGKLRRVDTFNLSERKKWKGIEVVSSPTNDYATLLEDVENISQILVKNGAKILKRLDNALHIHVDATDLTIEQVAIIPQRTLFIQDSLEKFCTINGMIVPKYTQDEADRFILHKDRTALGNDYFSSTERVSSIVNNSTRRRIVNISPWLSRPEPNRTVEFRCFSNSYSIDYIRESIMLSLDIFDYLLTGNLDFDLEERTTNIEKLHR